MVDYRLRRPWRHSRRLVRETPLLVVALCVLAAVALVVAAVVYLALA